MELKECITCGSHSFTGNKCDYCGNQYEVKEKHIEHKLNETAEKIKLLNQINYSDEDIELNQILDSSEDKKGNELAFKIMIWILISIIWFAVTVFIPPLFLITIIGLIIWVCRKVCKKY